MQHSYYSKENLIEPFTAEKTANAALLNESKITYFDNKNIKFKSLLTCLE